MRITIENATLVKDQALIIKPINLSATQQRIAIIGRNGAGKSSLVQMITGLTPPSDGRVLLDGVNPSKDRQAALALIGILFQNPDHQIIFPTVEEELAFGLRQQGKTTAEITQAIAGLLSQFGISNWAKRPIYALSHGQKQLLCLLSILVMKPKILVLDEPFSGLDMAMRLRLQAILNTLPQMIIHITHDIATIAHYDRVLWLRAGSIEMDGAPVGVLPAFQSAMEQEAEHAFTDQPA